MTQYLNRPFFYGPAVKQANHDQGLIIRVMFPNSSLALSVTRELISVDTSGYFGAHLVAVWDNDDIYWTRQFAQEVAASIVDYCHGKTTVEIYDTQTSTVVETIDMEDWINALPPRPTLEG